ncbi:hypothetical protein [Noviherbaspirillum aerium]|uniref:hypothetical protein n=1 Tax=Noviherbaspirillum aerium TaxID=2588497 RepID=UPI001CEF8CB3|nr:hypothetical protein [Noviherbaspirillum aerium]
MESLHKLGAALEFIKAANLVGVRTEVLSREEGCKFIGATFRKFPPHKTTGHLSLRGEIITIPLEKYEYTYSEELNATPAYVFFDQSGLDKNVVIRIGNAQKIGIVLKEAFGMEYFVSDENISYLIAVNWYAIEITGKAKELLASLSESK